MMDPHEWGSSHLTRPPKRYPAGPYYLIPLNDARDLWAGYYDHHAFRRTRRGFDLFARPLTLKAHHALGDTTKLRKVPHCQCVVSDVGHVLSSRRPGRLRLLKPWTDGAGNQCVKVYMNGRPTTLRVHRAMAACFGRRRATAIRERFHKVN